MTLSRTIGLVTFGVDITNGSTFAPLASIITPPSGPASKTARVQTTLLREKTHTYIGAQIEPGEITFSILYSIADTTTSLLATLFSNSNVANWQITYPDASTGTFHGYVAGFSRKMSPTEAVQAEITIQLCGGDAF